MPRRSPGHGTFNRVDLTTPDPAGARRFYGNLFGWTSRDLRTGDSGTYTIFLRDGDAVAGLGVRSRRSAGGASRPGVRPFLDRPGPRRHAFALFAPSEG